MDHLRALWYPKQQSKLCLGGKGLSVCCRFVPPLLCKVVPLQCINFCILCSSKLAWRVPIPWFTTGFYLFTMLPFLTFVFPLFFSILSLSRHCCFFRMYVVTIFFGREIGEWQCKKWLWDHSWGIWDQACRYAVFGTSSALQCCPSAFSLPQTIFFIYYREEAMSCFIG